MDHHPPPEPPTDQYDDATNINRLFDELVHSSEEAEEAGRALSEWRTQHPEPPVPPVFDGSNELAEYRKRRAAYQRDLDTLTQRRDDARRTHLEAATEAAGLLPEGSRLNNHQDSRGRRYEIVHRTGSVERPVIVLRQD